MPIIRGQTYEWPVFLTDDAGAPLVPASPPVFTTTNPRNETVTYTVGTQAEATAGTPGNYTLAVPLGIAGPWRMDLVAPTAGGGAVTAKTMVTVYPRFADNAV